MFALAIHSILVIMLADGSEEVLGVGCGILANLQLLDTRCIRVNGEQSIKAVIAAMDSCASSKKIAGLGSLALANLLYKASKRRPHDFHVSFIFLHLK